MIKFITGIPMSFKKILTFTFTVLVFSSTPLLAKMGSESIGGGGDSSEARVNEIRSDILNWIKSEGAKGLELSNIITYDEYVSKMTIILQPQKVTISFTDDKVIYDTAEKTCKGFIEEESSEKHILCNISRFTKTSDSDQYKLIHHEYAGLAGIEKNEGAASDYDLSSQITEFLTYETVLRLNIKKVITKECTLSVKKEELIYLNIHGVIESLKSKNYTITSKEEAKYSLEKFFFSCAKKSLASSYVNDQGLSLFYCDDMSADLILKNNITGERLNSVGHFVRTEESRPTTGNVLSDLMNYVPECK